MEKRELCLNLERRITRELSGFDDADVRRMWCDGIALYELHEDESGRYLSGTAWIGNDGQTEMQLKLRVPPTTAEGGNIGWADLLPPLHLTEWIFVDVKKKLVEIDLSKARALEGK